MSGKFALIIGNSEYSDPGLAQLSAPGKDAEDFARVLRSPDICAFDEVNIVLNQTEHIVRDAIYSFFSQATKDDLLLLFFSGHGIRDDLGTLYLAVKDTNRLSLPITAISKDFVLNVSDRSRTKRQVIILDCCNSGAFAEGTKAEIGGTMGMTKALEGFGRFILTASDAVQFAWEGNKVIGETDNSLFTHFLVKGLEGEADNDGDGRITVDELYDYAFDQISRATPKQTPTKSSSKVEGEIVLRQNMRIEDIKPVGLPDDLISEIEDLRPSVREWAVQRLEKILRGKNLGLARSAKEALEKIAAEDDSRRVSQAATQALESIRQIEQKAEEERKARDEAERLVMLKVEEERLAHEKAETERKAKEEAEKLAREEAERETAERNAVRLQREREDTAKAVRDAAEKVAKEKTQYEAAERFAVQKAEEERVAKEKKEKIDAEQLAEEKRLSTEKASVERKSKKENLAHVKTNLLDKTPADISKSQFIYVIVNDGTPLYHSLPSSNNWTVWLEKGTELSLTKAIEDTSSIGKYGHYIEAVDKQGNEGYVTATAISFERPFIKRTEEERLDRLKATIQQEVVEEIASIPSKPAKSFWTPTAIIGIVIIAVIVCGFASLNYLPGIFGGVEPTLPPPTEAPATTEPPPIQAVLPTLIPTEEKSTTDWQVIFENDFSARSEYPLGSEDYGKLSDDSQADIVADEYQLNMDSGGWVPRSIQSVQGDFRISFDVRIISADSNENSGWDFSTISFQETTSSHTDWHKIIFFDPNSSTFSVSQIDKDYNDISIISTTYSDAIIAGLGESNHVEVECINNTITVRINGQKVASFDHPTQGLLHYPGWTVYNLTKVGFDNLVVEQYR